MLQCSPNNAITSATSSGRDEYVDGRGGEVGGGEWR